MQYTPRLVLVDDDKTILDGLRRLLSRNQLSSEIHTCSRAEDALEHARAGRADVVVTDLKMPGMDGLALLRALKSSPATNHIQVLLFTGSREAETRKAALRDGALDFLSKPTDPVEFCARVRNAFALSSYHHRLREHSRRLELQLVEAQRMHVLGLMAGGVLHDLKNLVASLVGRSELAAQLIAEEHPAAAHMSAVKRVATRLTHVIHQVIAVGRPDQDAEVVDVLAVIQESMATLELLAPPGVTISCSPSVEQARFKVNPGQVAQILLNLSMNALDAVGASGRIHIDLSHDEQEETPGRAMILTVRDSGPGMDDLTLSRMWDPYFTTKESRGGTGLGLAIVKRLVSELGATISVRSRPGEGTAFAVRFPSELTHPLSLRGEAERSA